MAVIFYWANKSPPKARPIYGVHPDANIEVPDGVVSMAVSGAPHKIAWPITPNHNVGQEEWSVVDTTGAQPILVVDAARVPPPNPDDELAAALMTLQGTGATVDQLIDALMGKTGKKGRITARSLA
jgi:hypothetical protein